MEEQPRQLGRNGQFVPRDSEVLDWLTLVTGENEIVCALREPALLSQFEQLRSEFNQTAPHCFSLRLRSRVTVKASDRSLRAAAPIYSCKERSFTIENLA